MVFYMWNFVTGSVRVAECFDRGAGRNGMLGPDEDRKAGTGGRSLLQFFWNKEPVLFSNRHLSERALISVDGLHC